ncbi:uncharacterized protein CBL_10313 [Carabus blaptoides fortunei]
MRTKNFIILLCLIIGVSFVLILFGPQRPESFQTIVSTTHQQIRNFQDTLRDAEQKNLIADEKYLKLLGFTTKPRLYPNDTWHNTSLPVVVTYVFDGQESQAIGLINNIGKILTNNTVLVYNLGLGSYSLQTLLNYCNSSRCQVVNFNFDEFPSHVQEERLHAYRPLIIQDALHKTGAILFLENNQRFTHQMSSELFDNLFRSTIKTTGILTWPMKKAVSSLTHKKMFEYFHTDAENFLFQQMVDAQRLILVNTDHIHQYIMLPWIQCSLTQDCIHPIGAQSAGCRFDKKPQYRYSGCHSYDLSALNIVLGLRFKHDSSQYSYRGAKLLFASVDLETAASEFAELERNQTSTDGKALSAETAIILH